MLGETVEKLILRLGLIFGAVDGLTELIQQPHSILIAFIEKVLLVGRKVLVPLPAIRPHVYPF
jgi:hypothetical protein